MRFEQRLDVAQVGFERAHRFPGGLQGGEQLVGRFLGPLAACDLFRLAVPLGLEPLDPRDQLAPLGVKRDDAIELVEGIGVETTRQRSADPIGVVAEASEVEHGISSARCRARGCDSHS